LDSEKKGVERKHLLLLPSWTSFVRKKGGKKDKGPGKTPSVSQSEKDGEGWWFFSIVE